jgi:hypothetical protein
MAVDFSGPAIELIEEALQDERPGGWQRLDAAALDQFTGIAPRAGWILPVLKGQFAASTVDRLLVLVDHVFPASDPRIAAPDLKIGEWPHVESGGLLCLRGTARAAPAGDRVRRAIADAADVLDMDAAARADDFAREFINYWRHFTTEGAPRFVTLMAPQAVAGDVYFVRLSKRNLVVLSDDEPSLRRWLESSGESGKGQFRRTRLSWLPQPWQPSDFPHVVSDVSGVFGAEFASYLHPRESLPVLFGATTPTGNVLVGVDIPYLPRKHFRNGFRPNAKIPGAMLAALSAGHQISRCRVERGDAAWVHGRGRDPQQAVLAHKSVAVIGCGALGSAVARLLAQMGVGSLVLVDGDVLTSANTSRHLLGAPWVGKNKAIGIGHRLRRDFPELASVEWFESRFEKLTEGQLARIAECDLVTSAGIDWTGDLVLDQWRRGLTVRPVHWRCSMATPSCQHSRQMGCRTSDSQTGPPKCRPRSWRLAAAMISSPTVW